MPSQYFNNRLLVAPQVEVALDDSQMQPSTPTTIPQIAVGVLGYSTQGAPKTAQSFTNIDQARAYFGQGTLLDGIARAFSPTPGGVGAPLVYGIRVNAATQGSLTLNDGSSVVALTLTTADSGMYTRSMSANIMQASSQTGVAGVPQVASPGQVSSTGVPYGARKVTTTNGSVTATGDYLGYVPLQTACAVSGGSVFVAPWQGTLAAVTNQVTSYAISTQGSGYTPGTYTGQAFTGGGGAGAQATVVINASGNITSVTMTAGGSGYTSAPTLSLTGLGSGSGFTGTATIAPGTQSLALTAGANYSGYQLGVGAQLVLDSGANQETITVTAVASAGAGSVTITAAFQKTHAATTPAITNTPYLLFKGTLAADNAGFPLNAYATLQALAIAANAFSANWQVLVPFNMNPVPSAQGLISGTSSPSVLDVMTAASTSAPSAPITLTANAGFATSGSFTYLTGITQAVTDWLNSQADPYFTAVRAPYSVAAGGSIAGGTIIAPTTAAVFAAGGADDASGGSLLGGTLAVTTGDWSNALTALQGVDTPLFVLMSNSAAVHALGDAHAQYMSVQGKMERLHICGGAQGETTAQALTRAQNLNSQRSVVCYPGIQDYDNQGNLATRDCYYAAALVAGALAGAGETVSLTNQPIRISGLEARSAANGGPFAQADYDQLIQGGVLGIQYKTTRGYVVAQSITTWLQDAKFTKREISTRRIADRVIRAVREKLENDISLNVGPGLINNVMADTQGVLSYYAARGYLVGDDTNQPYSSIAVSTQPGRADTVLVEFQISPAVPCNYILGTVHAVAYGSTLQS